ncbi:uncharacterized protein LOC118185567 isoform X2 [Stegodyphus dumicola]|uniref:uncharacterized protein LOC118185567 isoform X2 n=1 Tax=Stegodyphus dumicola TaxID=202533 RepID=UPI0015ACBAB3|nr:uncharacterized protein LOC118185567 isoform X2 [Stegodyphus dumicola]
MWVLFVTVLLIASAALGKDDICEKRSWEVCDPGVPFVFPSNEKEFDEECHIALDETKCRQEHAIKCETDELEEVNGIVEFLQDVCRKGSSLNEVLRPNIGCIKENVIKDCSENVRTVHNTYRDYLNTTSEEFSDEEWLKLMCMSLAYDVACAANAVSVPCGSMVKDAVIESNRHVDWMEKKTMCTRSVREEITKDIPAMDIKLVEKVILEELLLDV